MTKNYGKIRETEKQNCKEERRRTFFREGQKNQNKKVRIEERYGSAGQIIS